MYTQCAIKVKRVYKTTIIKADIWWFHRVIFCCRWFFFCSLYSFVFFFQFWFGFSIWRTIHICVWRRKVFSVEELYIFVYANTYISFLSFRLNIEFEVMLTALAHSIYGIFPSQKKASKQTMQHIHMYTWALLIQSAINRLWSFSLFNGIQLFSYRSSCLYTIL